MPSWRVGEWGWYEVYTGWIPCRITSASCNGYLGIEPYHGAKPIRRRSCGVWSVRKFDDVPIGRFYKCKPRIPASGDGKP